MKPHTSGFPTVAVLILILLIASCGRPMYGCYSVKGMSGYTPKNHK